MFDIEDLVMELERDFQSLVAGLSCEQRLQVKAHIHKIEWSWASLIEEQNWIIGSLQQLVQTTERLIAERGDRDRRVEQASGSSPSQNRHVDTMRCEERSEMRQSERVYAHCNHSATIEERNALTAKVKRLKRELEDTFQKAKLVLAESRETKLRVEQVADDICWSSSRASDHKMQLYSSVASTLETNTTPI